MILFEIYCYFLKKSHIKPLSFFCYFSSTSPSPKFQNLSSTVTFCEAPMVESQCHRVPHHQHHHRRCLPLWPSPIVRFSLISLVLSSPNPAMAELTLAPTLPSLAMLLTCFTTTGDNITTIHCLGLAFILILMLIFGVYRKCL